MSLKEIEEQVKKINKENEILMSEKQIYDRLVHELREYEMKEKQTDIRMRQLKLDNEKNQEMLNEKFLLNK